MRTHNELTLPGFVCAHTHLYSSLARGMPAPRETPRNFVEILERVWWRLDRALDAEAVEVSALVGAIEAAKAGCTTLVDHHASPGRGGAAVDGSLDLVAAAVAEVGLRAVVCYEVSDRNGAAEARAGIRENERFLARVRLEPPRLVRALVGAHAAFTLSDETAEAIADVARRHRAGVHIHVAEDVVDARKDGRSTVAWLQARGLLDERTLLAHCVHVDDTDVARIRDAGASVVHNPRSNANNAVGYAHPSRFGDRLLLGTDGIGADMRAEAQFAFFAARDHGDPLDPGAVLARNRDFAAGLFGLEELGDSVTLDYASPTPIDDGNFGGHFLFGLGAARVRDVVVDGHVVVRDGVCINVDEERIYARAREVAARLWARL
ncbi:MAG TPA: amidohydrolase family protein [Polyangia bacterium]|jgi:putative selenium metabolism protein SsnA